MHTRRILALLAATFIAGSALAASSKPVEPRPLDGYAKTEDGKVKILLLPSHFLIYQLGASGVTTHEIPEWSRSAEEYASGAVRAYFGLSKQFAAVEMPELSEDEKALVEEHLALAEVVGYNAWINRAIGGGPWKHKQKQFDMELGDKLAFLRERTGADVAVFAVGMDAYSTGGRVALGVMTTLLFGAAPVSFPSIVVIGVVDLRTGRIVWANQGEGGTDLRDIEKVYEYVDNSLCEYPRSQLLRQRTPDCRMDWEPGPDGKMTAKPRKRAK